MVFNKLKKAAEQGLDAAKGLGDTLNDAARSGMEAANDIGKAGWERAESLTGDLKNVVNDGAEFLKAVKDGTFTVVSDTADGIYQAGSYAVKTADGYVGFSTFVGKTIEFANGDYSNVRTNIAEGIRNNSSTVADGTVLAAQVASAVGFFPIGGFIVERYGKNAIEGGADYLSKLIRGGQIEFIDTEVIGADVAQEAFGNEKDVLAIMYMPKGEGANRAGFAVMNEDALKAMVVTQDENSHEREVYTTALAAVIEKKAELGLIAAIAVSETQVDVQP